MNKLLKAYLSYKKITIPVTVLVASLAVGGAVYGVTSVSKDTVKEVASEKTTTKTEKVVEKEENDNEKTTETVVEDEVTVETSTETASKKEEAVSKKQTAATGNSNKSAAASTGKKDAAGGGSSVSANTDSTTTSTNNSNTTTPSTNNNGYIYGQKVVCSTCGSTYLYGMIECTHPTSTCRLCKETFYSSRSEAHDCQYTTDCYGNPVRKDSRYAVRVGNFGCVVYSDGTIDITEEAYRALTDGYECAILARPGSWSSLEEFIAGHI